MKKLIFVLVTFLLVEFSPNLFGQTATTITGEVVGEPIELYSGVLWNQMNSPGTASITSQNFEAVNDIYDSFAADDFGLMDDIWSVTQVDVLGAYYNGSGPASSVNVWFYSDSAGLPNQIIYSALNITPVNGLTTGSFSIILPNPVVLLEGMYWFCVQANMNQNPYGQWGWTERTASNFNESAWKNPGGGFGTTCTSWKHRVTECSVGTGPDLCFSLIGDIVPVELTSFEAAVSNNNVELKWTTATETNNHGFEIQRSLTPTPSQREGALDNWRTIGFENGNGTTTEPQAYSFVDEKLSAGKPAYRTGRYQYRLKQIDFNGTFEYSKIIEIDISLLEEFSLEQNYPNPFNPTTKISWRSPISSHQSLRIYDVLGNEVETLVDEYRNAGSYDVEFNPVSSIKYPASGIYFYQLKAGDFIQTKKMIILK